MSWLGVVIIVLAVLLIRERSRHKATRRLMRQAQQAMPPPAAEPTLEQRELAQLQERLAVLERIATDENSPSAIETRRIADEIEALRDREDADRDN